MNHLGVFAKYWEPGSVKTRLAAAIGNRNAAGLYHEFVRQTLVRQSNTGDHRSVWVTPPDQAQAFEALTTDNWQIHQQSAGNLGDRMLDFFTKSFAATGISGESRVVLIGSDSPTLEPSLIQQAFDLLDLHPLVLGPSHDGGYVLIGMRARPINVFHGVNWSTESVLEQTMTIAEGLNLTAGLLPIQNDIDELDDLKQLRMDLENRVTDNRSSQWDEELLTAIKRFGVIDNVEC